MPVIKIKSFSSIALKFINIWKKSGSFFCKNLSSTGSRLSQNSFNKLQKVQFWWVKSQICKTFAKWRNVVIFQEIIAVLSPKIPRVSETLYQLKFCNWCPFSYLLKIFLPISEKKKSLRRDNLKIERYNLQIKCVFSSIIYKLTSFWLGIIPRWLFCWPRRSRSWLQV